MFGEGAGVLLLEGELEDLHTSGMGCDGAAEGQGFGESEFAFVGDIAFVDIDQEREDTGDIFLGAIVFGDLLEVSRIKDFFVGVAFKAIGQPTQGDVWGVLREPPCDALGGSAVRDRGEWIDLDLAGGLGDTRPLAML